MVFAVVASAGARSALVVGRVSAVPPALSMSMTMTRSSRRAWQRATRATVAAGAKMPWNNEYPGVGYRESVVGTLPLMQIVTRHR
jgi:hypothetical protein